MYVYCVSVCQHDNLSPSQRREAPCEGTNSPRLFTPGETKALAKSKVHQWSWAWLTNDVSVGGHPHWSQNMWQTIMNSEHWLVQFKVCIITTAWRQRNSKHFLIWWLINFLQIYFIYARIFARFCKFQKLSQKERAKESAKRREPTLTKVSLFKYWFYNCFKTRRATAFAYMKQLNKTAYNFSVSLILIPFFIMLNF
jgi:hypothetical protein